MNTICNSPENSLVKSKLHSANGDQFSPHNHMREKAPVQEDDGSLPANPQTRSHQPHTGSDLSFAVWGYFLEQRQFWLDERMNEWSDFFVSNAQSLSAMQQLFMNPTHFHLPIQKKILKPWMLAVGNFRGAFFFFAGLYNNQNFL